MASLEANCPLLLHDSATGQLKESELQAGLESKDDAVKIKALKSIINATVNGQPLPKLLMHVIKYTLHSTNHAIKKLSLHYWDVVEKRQSNGKLLHEMILVCNALKNNLTHPNEYIRGSTLRFLCRLKEADILESGLISSITDNLSHRHSYVRKNAVMCLYTVHQNFPELVPDAPEIVETFLATETNPPAKRNAFLMLSNCAPERATNYLASTIQTVAAQSESFQLLVLEHIKKVCRQNPLAKSQYIQCIHGLVNSPCTAVAFEGANTLVTLSNAPTAVRAAVASYCQLLSLESDNNIKLVILGRLSALKRRNEKILQEMLMDVLRTLASPNIDIRRKTLELALDLVSPRNVTDVVTLLKKEIQGSSSSANKADEYRKILVDAMHKCAVKFPEVVESVVPLLISQLSDENAASAQDVIIFVREIVEDYLPLRDSILTKLLESLSEVRATQVFRIALWILGEYAEGAAMLDTTILTVRELLGSLTFKAEEKKEELAPEDASAKPKVASGPVILADGTYAMSSAHSAGIEEKKKIEASIPNANSNLRSLILAGDFYLGACLTNCMVKLSLKFAKINGWASRETHEELAKTLMMCVSLLRLGEPDKEKPMDSDSRQRILMCIRVLLEPEKYMEVFMGKSRETFIQMLKEQRTKEGPRRAAKKVQVENQADELITIRQLKKGNDGMDEFDYEDIHKALSHSGASDKLNRVYQLTGFADPVYVEAQLTVLDYDICLQLLMVNQTDQTLQNVTLELNTSGDLKLVERPSPFTLKPNGSQKMTANIKVTSTESGTIFGNIVYCTANGVNQTIVVLNSIHMDVIDYISPASVADSSFTTMWQEFEWENKVAVNTDINDLNTYLEHICKITNMQCMTPQASMSGSCQFLAANLYARSIFGEDALLNLSVELQKNGKIGGYIRIRSKTQGIALSIGDKITSKQRLQTSPTTT